MLILDLQQMDRCGKGLMNVVFCNKSLRFFDDLRRLVMPGTYFPASSSPTLSIPNDPAILHAELEFKEWATNSSGHHGLNNSYLPRHSFPGMFWNCTPLRGHWRIINTSIIPNQRRQSNNLSKSSRSTSRSTTAPTASASLTSMSDMDASAIEEVDLSKQLAESESKFRVLTELNPVGMYWLNPAGNILYCNDMWFEITRRKVRSLLFRLHFDGSSDWSAIPSTPTASVGFWHLPIVVLVYL